MDVLEEREVEKYLSDKKLPLDLYLEIKEHIALQIEDLGREKNVGFQEAFLQVQKRWKKDLSFDQRISLSNPNQIPKIVAKIRQAYLKEIFPKVSVITLLLEAILFCGAFLLRESKYHVFFIVIYAAVFALPYAFLIANFKMFRVMSIWKSREVNVYQKLVHGGFAMMTVPMIFAPAFMITSWEHLYSAFNHQSVLMIIVTILAFFYIFGVCVYTLFIFFKFKKQYNLTPTAK